MTGDCRGYEPRQPSKFRHVRLAAGELRCTWPAVARAYNCNFVTVRVSKQLQSKFLSIKFASIACSPSIGTCIARTNTAGSLTHDSPAAPSCTRRGIRRDD